METIEIASECHRGLVLDHSDHHQQHLLQHRSADIDRATALCAELLSQSRGVGEPHSSQQQQQQQRLQDTVASVAAMQNITLQTSVANADGHRAASLASAAGAVFVVSDAKLGLLRGDDDDEEDDLAPVPSHFAFPLPPTFTIEQQRELLTFSNNTFACKNDALSLPSSSLLLSSSHPLSSSTSTNQPPMSLHRSPASKATISPKTESTLPSPLPACIRAHMSRDRVMISPSASDVSEVPLDAYAEGEVLEMAPSDNDCWDHHSPYHYSATKVRLTNARSSSSTLFDESRPSSQQSWTQQIKDDNSDSRHASPILFHPPPSFEVQQKYQHQHQYQNNSRNSHEQALKRREIAFVDQSLRSSKGQTTVDSSSSNSCADSPSWTTGARFKMEPSTPVRPVSHGKDSGTQSTKGSSPLSTPTTPLTPTPDELDKPTKNLMMFNKIPRQWPSSQETLHHNFMTKASKKTPVVIKEFDPATAERIDRVINKERPLSRAAKERLAAEQKEAELEARGFFDPARRWKGRDVYPRPANWVYCRRTKNNWLEKSKILADAYKLFKGQVLGKGHHADVYRGVDLTTGNDLAIKVIYKTVTRRLGFINEDPMQEVKNRRLLNEVWFIDYLKDAPGICKILRVVETATKFYFVMELAQSDLNSYSNGINMREEEIRYILKPIFECLKYAHSHDITHRDIKPENILLRTRKDWLRTSTQGNLKNRSGATASASINHSSALLDSLQNIDDASSTLGSTLASERTYKNTEAKTTDGRSSIDSATLYSYDHRFDAFLADWGLAMEHDCNSGRKPVGTPLYAAPEVVRKMKKIRRREWINYRACDIWSLGVTMFVVASGVYPYHTHDALEAQSPPNWGLLESSGMSREYILFTQRLMNLTAELRPSAAEACNDPWLRG
ncbi:hypothetical protein BGZ99_005056 [Dissophora globulifera]|uniref:Protein kinase domain-containing protein n=1 Tax=Dissophora globulifera TaxID=979702 RepID=A0A9P6UZU0_9FUNG|nr:hypothetical protein BGZ99_005056 [Dissophora globulifera]